MTSSKEGLCAHRLSSMMRKNEAMLYMHQKPIRHGHLLWSLATFSVLQFVHLFNNMSMVKIVKKEGVKISRRQSLGESCTICDDYHSARY